MTSKTNCGKKLCVQAVAKAILDDVQEYDNSFSENTTLTELEMYVIECLDDLLDTVQEETGVDLSGLNCELNDSEMFPWTIAKFSEWIVEEYERQN